MITLYLTESEARSVLAISARLMPLVPSDRAKRKTAVCAVIDSDTESDPVFLARHLKSINLYSAKTSDADIVRTIEHRRAKQTQAK